MEWAKQSERHMTSLAAKGWIMKQTWKNVLFLHWPIEPAYLRGFIPKALQLDTYEGLAWLGIIVFEIGGIYPRGLSRLSLTPPFSEINVRTYVTCKGKPGIYFLSIDVQHWASLHIAKRWYHLPYHPAKVTTYKEGDTFYFEGIRKKEPWCISGSYTPQDDAASCQTGQLGHWLTERYRLYSSDRFSNIYTARVDHPPWPLQKADVILDQNKLFSPFDLQLSAPTPLAHYSYGVQTNFWNIKKIK